MIYLMNLDYRKGSINFADLNSSTGYDPTTAFTQSQLANMVTVQTMAKDLAKNNITVNAVRPTNPTHPNTDLYHALHPGVPRGVLHQYQETHGGGQEHLWECCGQSYTVAAHQEPGERGADRAVGFH